jgi:hypothetical protein
MKVKHALGDCVCLLFCTSLLQICVAFVYKWTLLVSDTLRLHLCLTLLILFYTHVLVAIVIPLSRKHTLICLAKRKPKVGQTISSMYMYCIDVCICNMNMWRKCAAAMCSVQRIRRASTPGRRHVYIAIYTGITWKMIWILYVNTFLRSHWQTCWVTAHVSRTNALYNSCRKLTRLAWYVHVLSTKGNGLNSASPQTGLNLKCFKWTLTTRWSQLK